MRLAVLATTVMLGTLAQAAPPDHYRVGTAAELVRVCDTRSSAADYTTAVAFCHGVLAGAYGYYLASTPAAHQFICAPEPAPTRSQVANGFVAWMKGRPQLMNDGAIDALFRYAAETFPCRQ